MVESYRSQHCELIKNFLENPHSAGNGREKLSSILKNVRDNKINVIRTSCGSFEGLPELRKAIVNSASSLTIPEKWAQISKTIMENAGHYYVTVEQLDSIRTQEEKKITFRIYNMFFKEKLCKEREIRLAVVLKFLHAAGHILYYADVPGLQEFIFPNLNAVIETMKTLLSHDLKENLTYKGEFQKFIPSRSRFNIQKERFIDQGILSKNMLACVWSCFNMTIHDVDIFVNLLKEFCICYEVKSDHDEESYLKFPWFIKDPAPDNITQQLTTHLRLPSIKLQAQFHFTDGMPLQCFDTFSVILHRFLNTDFRKDYRNLVRAHHNNATIFLHQNYNKSTDVNQTITLSVTDHKDDIVELIKLFQGVVREYHDYLLRTCEGVLCDIRNVCPHCIIVRDDNPSFFNGFHLTESCSASRHVVHCEKTKEPVPSVMKFKLPDMNDERYRKHSDELKKCIQRWSKLQADLNPSEDQETTKKSDLDIVCDMDFSILAKHMTHPNWKQFAYEYLGVSGQVVDEADYKRRTHESVYEAAMLVLQSWRKECGLAATVSQLRNLCLEASRKDGMFAIEAYQHLDTN